MSKELKYFVQILNFDVGNPGELFTLCQEHLSEMRYKLQKKGFNGVAEVRGMSFEECNHCRRGNEISMG